MKSQKSKVKTEKVKSEKWKVVMIHHDCDDDPMHHDCDDDQMHHDCDDDQIDYIPLKE